MSNNLSTDLVEVLRTPITSIGFHEIDERENILTQPFKKKKKAITIFTVNAICGAGKTWHAINWAGNTAVEGGKVLLVQPTKALIEETYQKLLERFPHLSPFVQKIISIDDESNHWTKCDPVAPRLKKALYEELPAYGEVILITHETFFSFSFQKSLKNWSVLVDEAPEAFKYRSLNIRETHQILTPYIETRPSIYPGFSSLHSKKDKQSVTSLNKLSRNRSKDQNLNTFRDIANALLSSNFTIYVKNQDYDAITKKGSDSDRKSLQFFIVLNSDIFRRFAKAILLSADSDKSIFALLNWDNLKFKPFRPIQDKIMVTKHLYPFNVKFLFISEFPWSITLMQKKHKDNLTYIQHAVRCVEEFLKNHDYLYSMNKDRLNKFKIDQIRGKAMLGRPYGLNNYINYTEVAIFSAMNPTPDSFAFLEMIGLSSQQVREAINFQDIYQKIMRSALRDPNNIEPVIVILPDKQSAEWMKTKFDSVKAIQLPGMPEIDVKPSSGRPKAKTMPKTPAERQADCRRRKALLNSN